MAAQPSFDPDIYLQSKASPAFDPDGYLASKSAPQQSAFDPDKYVAEKTQERVRSLLSDQKFDKTAAANYAIETGDKETAFQARQALKNQSWGEWSGRMGETLAEPQTYGNALAGTAKFAGGLVAAPLHGVAQIGATVGAPIARAVGADNLANTLENEQQTQGAESTLAGQRVEEGLKGTYRAVRNFAQDHPILAGVANPALALAPQRQPTTEADERARFDEEIQAAKNTQQLAQSKPLETGAVAGAAKLATGQDRLADVYSPEALQAQGARPVSPLLTESMSAAGDPTNLAIPLAGEIPGVKTLAGGIVQGVGKVLQAPEAIMAQIPKVGRIGRMAEGGAAAYEAFHNPALAAKAAGVYGLGKVLGWAGRALDEQGAAFRSGIPSALDETAQSAASAGQSAINANAQRFIGNTANNAVAASLGFAPLNYVLSGGDPRQFAQSEVNVGALGATFGMAGERGRTEDIAAYRLARYGSQPFSENPLYQQHQAVMQTFAPEDQAAINTLRGALYGGTGTDVLVLDGQSFAKQAGAIGGDARGQFVADPNGSTVYLNADAIAGTPAERAANAQGTAGHEAGHAIVDFLKNAGREGDAQAMFTSMAQGMPTDALQTLAETYRQKLADSTPGYKNAAPDQKAAIEAKIATDNPPEKILEENLAEITRQILTGRSIASFALPKPLSERLTDAASRFMEDRGWMPRVDDGASLGFKAQMVREAARRMNDVLYETGKTAQAAIDQGPTTTQQLMEARAQLEKLPQITPNMPMAQARAVQRQRDAAQKQIDEVQGMLGQQPQGVAPASQQSTPSSSLNLYRIAAILRRQGLSQDEAKQWAGQARGATDEEAVVDALRQRANQKYPTINPTQPQAPNERPVSTPPPNEPLPTGGGGVQPGVGGNTATVEPVSVPAKDVGGTGTPETPVVHTPDDLDTIAAKAREDFLADKALAKAGKNKGQHTAANQKAADKSAFDAAAEAHAATVPANYQGMRQRVDAFGKKAVSGQLDPSRPFDSWLIDRARKSGMLTDAGLETMLRLQDAIGSTVTYDYGHAPVAEAGEQPTGESRAAQQAEHTVKKRLAGESPMQTEPKTSIPLSIAFNSGSNSFTVFGASPEKLLNNFNHITDALTHLKIASPYRDINDPQLVADIKAVIRNHQNGWQGDGSRPAIGTAEYPNVANPDWANSPERTQIPPDRFNFVNMMLGDEGAKAGTPQAKAKAHLANENRRLVNEAGETNELRQQINDAIPWVDKSGNPASWSEINLEDPLNENISPALASNVREASQSDESIRQHGKVGDLGRFFAEGRTPDRAKTAAGFMPTEDTGRPEDGSTPGERLAREAEAAGLTISLGALKGLIQQDKGAMDRVRQRILEATGKPARFMPTDTTADDMAIQSSWLQNEAKSAGYASLSDFLQNEPDRFAQMAAQWREFHPRDQQGMLLQNDRVRAINNALYGDTKSDAARPLAGARDALGNAASYVGANAGAGGSKAERAALAKWAEDNALAFRNLPAQADLNSPTKRGGMEHDVWPDAENQRWIKSTRGMGESMGVIPTVTKDGGWALTKATPLQYLQSRQLQNQVFGDDVRLHGIWNDGRNVNVITSQPHIAGQKPTQPQIDKAMETRGFTRMDDATYYRKGDNVAVFDLHPENAFIHKGALLPIDAIVLHPSEELLDALKDSQLSILNRKPAPTRARTFMEAAQMRMREREMAGAH
jgi:Serine/Threonine/Tyrosine Kinase found in polyvalent proteins